MKNLHKVVAARFAKELAVGLKEPGYDFAEVVQRGTGTARETFLDGAKGLSLSLVRPSVLIAHRGQGGGDGLGV